MREIRVAAAQFEARDGEKEYNLGRIRKLAKRAVQCGAELVCFHECCISGYSFLEGLERPELERLAEPVPGGRSTQAMTEIARELGVALAAGLLEVAPDGALRNTYVVVSPDGPIAQQSKLHPFISEHLSPGEGYCVFELFGCTFGILICYDNNIIENVRMTTLLGADVILMPHVTGGLPSPMPGRGKIAREVWENRDRDPVRCRMEFMGPKGRGWLMHWLPARAYDNGIYAVFANPVGVDADTVKPGNAMIIDPFGEVLVESHALGDDVVVGLLTPEKIEQSGGRRYIRARRPELYGRLVESVPEEEANRRSSQFADVYWKKHRDG
ncbi:MAG: nitrilase family protein [Candidatus Brocadiia bacterium]